MARTRTAILAATLALYWAATCCPSAQAQDDKRLNEQAIAATQKVPYDGRFAFVVIGDNRDNDPMFSYLLEVANRMDPLFIINVGDFVFSGLQAQYDNYVRLISPSKAPAISVLGNHDVRHDGREIFARMFGPEDFYFDYGNCRFICLDNSDYELTDEQLAWAERLLDTGLHTFVFMHVPPKTARWLHDFDRGADRFMELMKRYQVDYVFLGHIHMYDRQVIDGITYIVTGGAGAPPHIEYEGGGFGFVYMQVDGDRIVDFAVLLEPM